MVDFSWAKRPFTRLFLAGSGSVRFGICFHVYLYLYQCVKPFIWLGLWLEWGGIRLGFA